MKRTLTALAAVTFLAVPLTPVTAAPAAPASSLCVGKVVRQVNLVEGRQTVAELAIYFDAESDDLCAQVELTNSYFGSPHHVELNLDACGEYSPRGGCINAQTARIEEETSDILSVKLPRNEAAVVRAYGGITMDDGSNGTLDTGFVDPVPTQIIPAV